MILSSLFGGTGFGCDPIFKPTGNACVLNGAWYGEAQYGTEYAVAIGNLRKFPALPTPVPPAVYAAAAHTHTNRHAERAGLGLKDGAPRARGCVRTCNAPRVNIPTPAALPSLNTAVREVPELSHKTLRYSVEVCVYS